MEAFTTDPLLASAHMRELSARLLAFDRALGDGPLALDPFRGQTTVGKTWREEVLASRDFEPIRGPLIGYIDYLLEGRINLEVSLEESTQLTQVSLPPRPPYGEAGTWSARRLFALSVASEPERQAEARLAWRALAQDASGLSAVRVLRYERRIEIEGRLGAGLSPLVSFDDPKESVAALARQVLVSTKDAAGSLLGAGFAGTMEAASGSPAVEGWPARLGTDALLDLLGGRWLIQDSGLVRLDLPGRLCPSSFPRAALRLGRDVFRVTVPESLPFVLARTPAETYGRTLGRLLGLWLLSPACARRRLGLGPEGRARHARGMARLLVAEARLLAVRALLAEAGRSSRSALDQTWGDLGSDLFGEVLGPPLGLLSAPPEAPVDLVALLWALSKEEELRASFDEDYLDNPRARELILAEVHGVEPPRPAFAVLDLAARGLSERVLASKL
jgi:hypothetical protein